MKHDFSEIFIGVYTPNLERKLYFGYKFFNGIKEKERTVALLNSLEEPWTVKLGIRKNSCNIVFDG